MNKDAFAPRPPMGWNSWDCYGASVNEEQLLGNARYMRDHLKAFGWEYVVCDIQWSEPTADSHDYHPFTPLCMDGFSRLVPAPERFPSAANGQGFAPIARQVHDMGLKFGIHIMRGIPRQAVHGGALVMGGHAAREIAQRYSLCPWNTDMYGVDMDKPGAQDYYDSLFALYADWGVDFVKVDDIANTEYRPEKPYSAQREIEAIRCAIDRCGRPIVLSLSPGPAPYDMAWHLAQHANMWRISGDFWDDWMALHAMFPRCEKWSLVQRDGAWPDCDMLPLGQLRVCEGGEQTRFTPDEQRTMMNLWCIFRSPLMMGGEMRGQSDQTLALLVNRDALHVNQHGLRPRQLFRTEASAAWTCDCDDGKRYVALFNLADAESAVTLPLPCVGLASEGGTEVWSGQRVPCVGDAFTVTLSAHASALILLDN